MASMVLGSIGSSIVGPLGGLLGSMLGGAIDQALFGAGKEDNRLKGDDLKVTRADPGTPIPWIHGVDRLPGIVVASTDLIETSDKVKGGGGGNKLGGMLGKGAGELKYSYHVDIDYMLCEGPVLGVSRIWANGNLIRGTRYDLALSTQNNPEKVAGIPYPDYYKDHYYEPDLIPWTIDRAQAPHNATDDGKFYKIAPNNTQMLEISSAEADSLVGTKVCTYWKDTASGYYIPTTQSHAYTGEEVVSAGDDALTKVTVQPQETDYRGGNAYSTWEYYIIDLNNYFDSGSLGKGYFDFYMPWSISSGLGFSSTIFYIDIEFYKGGSTDLVDYSSVGGFISSYGSSHSVDDGYTSLTGVFKEEGIEIPSGARYIVVKRKAVPWFVVFCNADYVHDSSKYTIWYGLDKSDGIRDWPDYWNFYDAINDWSPKAVLAFDGPEDVTVYHGDLNQPPDPTMAAALETDVPAYKRRAHIVFKTLTLERYSNRVPQFTFEVAQFDNARVHDIVESALTRSSISSDNYDISAITSESGVNYHVLGYSVTNKTSFRSILENVVEAFRIDAAEIGNTLVFRPMYREPDYIIEWSDLDAVESGDGLDSPVKLAFRDPTELPRRRYVRFKDPERNYQPNVAHYTRQQGLSVSDSTVDTGFVARPDLMKKYARDSLHDAYMHATGVQSSVPHKYVYIAPTDIVHINGADYGENSFTIKVNAVTRGDNGVIELEGSLYDQSIYDYDDGETDTTPMDGSTWTHVGSTNNITAFTYLTLLDLPPLLENHDQYGMYVGMSRGSEGTWSGASLYRSVDNESSYDAIFGSAASAVVGTVIGTPLGDGVAEYLDMDSVLRVELMHPTDTLENITSDELFQNRNAAAVGDEIIQFMNATEVSTGVWDLSVIARGRRGTDIPDIMAGHTTGERFILLLPGTVNDYADPLAYLNTQNHYKGVTLGAPPSQFPSQLFANTGRRITPLSPNHVTGYRDGSDNLTITWRRRDRAYQHMHDSGDIGNSESIEQYEIDIMSGASVVRTLTVDDTTSVVYSAADQTADGLTPGDPVTLRIYQISAVIGRGNKGEAVV